MALATLSLLEPQQFGPDIFLAFVALAFMVFVQHPSNLYRTQVRKLLKALRASERPVIIAEKSPHEQANCPPCESVVLDAERANKHNGHENLGFLSRSNGFMPLHQPLKRFSSSHALWDDIAVSLPALIQQRQLRTEVEKMPILDASADSLPDPSLHRAATVLAILAHSYIRLDGNTPLQSSTTSVPTIPAALEKPWTQVCQRLGRSGTFMTYADLVVYNYVTESTLWQDVDVRQLQLLVPTVGNKEEVHFYGTMIEINARWTPIIAEIIEAHRAVLGGRPALLKRALKNIQQHLLHVQRVTLAKISPKSSSSTYTDPIVWTKSVANLAVPWKKDVPGAAGTSHPFFHMMDEFFSRRSYNERMGKQAQQVRRDYPIHWRNFLAAIAKVSVSNYIMQKPDNELSRLWQETLETYQGSQGILARHRRKVFGYLFMSFRIGRSTTINGFKGKAGDEPWISVHNELEKARQERRQSSPDLAVHHSDRKESSSKSLEKEPPSYPISELIQHTNPQKGYWFAASGTIYNPTPYTHTHPGGATIIANCSGRDITRDLAAVSHLSDPKIKPLLASFALGRLAVADFCACAAPPPERSTARLLQLLQGLYDAAVALAYRLADLETTHCNHMRFLRCRLTRCDREAHLTPLKSRFWAESLDQLRTEYAPTIAAFAAPALRALGELAGDAAEAEAEMGWEDELAVVLERLEARAGGGGVEGEEEHGRCEGGVGAGELEGLVAQDGGSSSLGLERAEVVVERDKACLARCKGCVVEVLRMLEDLHRVGMEQRSLLSSSFWMVGGQDGPCATALLHQFKCLDEEVSMLGRFEEAAVRE